ncbi:hypothetical protein ACQ4PT_025557 [Festuca glaucescens]
MGRVKCAVSQRAGETQHREGPSSINSSSRWCSSRFPTRGRFSAPVYIHPEEWSTTQPGNQENLILPPSSMAPVDWSSLSPNLVNRVMDVFLATSDVDYYMILCAVYSNWRTSTDVPLGLDYRFRPLRWVMLKVKSRAGKDDAFGQCLFLNVDTERLIWKDQPMLRSYTRVVSTTDGLLVLETTPIGYGTYAICVLNPFTGHLVRVPKTGMFTADAETGIRQYTSVATYRGRAYVVDGTGTVVVLGDPLQPGQRAEITAVVTVDHDPSAPVAVWDPPHLLSPYLLPLLPILCRRYPVFARLARFGLSSISLPSSSFGQAHRPFNLLPRDSKPFIQWDPPSLQDTAGSSLLGAGRDEEDGPALEVLLGFVVLGTVGRATSDHRLPPHISRRRQAPSAPHELTSPPSSVADQCTPEVPVAPLGMHGSSIRPGLCYASETHVRAARPWPPRRKIVAVLRHGTPFAPIYQVRVGGRSIPGLASSPR